MEERFTTHQRDTLISGIRRGISMPEPQRDLYANNAKALLRLSDVYIETCSFLADICIKDMENYDVSLPEDWKEGVVEELMWWWLWINKKRSEGTLEAWGTLRSNPFPFESYVGKFKAEQKLRCLNIGCGPRPNMGEKTSHADLEIINMDPLASAYNSMMSFLNAPGGGDVVFGAVEIVDQLDLGKFNFIAAKNCLDHAYAVPEGLRKLISILGDSGVILLEHYENEAEAQGYDGFHKWNIEIVDDHMRIWSQNSSEIFPHKDYGLELNYKRKMSVKGTGVEHPMITISLSKGM